MYTVITTFANHSNSGTQTTAYTVLADSPEQAYEEVTIHAEKERDRMTLVSKKHKTDWFITDQWIADNAQVILTT